MRAFTLRMKDINQRRYTTFKRS